MSSVDLDVTCDCVFSEIRVTFIALVKSVRLMEEINVWVGPVVHKSILRFYMYCFCPCHQVACWVQFGLPVNF